MCCPVPGSDADPMSTGPYPGLGHRLCVWLCLPAQKAESALNWAANWKWLRLCPFTCQSRQHQDTSSSTSTSTSTSIPEPGQPLGVSISKRIEPVPGSDCGWWWTWCSENGGPRTPPAGTINLLHTAADKFYESWQHKGKVEPSNLHLLFRHTHSGTHKKKRNTLNHCCKFAIGCIREMLNIFNMFPNHYNWFAVWNNFIVVQ